MKTPLFSSVLVLSLIQAIVEAQAPQYVQMAKPKETATRTYSSAHIEQLHPYKTAATQSHPQVPTPATEPAPAPAPAPATPIPQPAQPTATVSKVNLPARVSMQAPPEESPGEQPSQSALDATASPFVKMTSIPPSPPPPPMPSASALSSDGSFPSSSPLISSFSQATQASQADIQQSTVIPSRYKANEGTRSSTPIPSQMEPSLHPQPSTSRTQSIRESSTPIPSGIFVTNDEDETTTSKKEAISHGQVAKPNLLWILGFPALIITV